LITKVYSDYQPIKTFHVSGAMPTNQRASQMRLFAESKGLMTNARCLTEGVDLPAIDCVCFTDPKRSRVDIVQAAGRALRLSKGKKFGYILIPIFVSKNQDPNEAAEDSGFEEVIATVGALSTQDTRIADYLRGVAEGRIPRGGNPVDGITKVNVLTKIDSDIFEKSIKLKIWDKIARINYRSFEEARRFIHKLKLNSGKEFREFRRLNKIPKDIPSKPSNVYKNKGWFSMGDFLGTGRVADQLKVYRSFKEAKIYVHGLKLKNLGKWKKWKKSGKLPKDIPRNPSRTYKNKGWKGWGDFLGTGFIASQFRKYRSFAKAKAYIRKLKLNSGKEFKKLAKSGKLPKDIPKNPSGVYKNKGWTAMGIFLGYRSRVPYEFRKFRSFTKARKYARKLKLKNSGEWNKFSKTEKFPKDMSTSPKGTYANKGWKGWGDFLGTGVIAPQFRNYRSFTKARMYARSLKLKSRKEWNKFSKTGKLPKDMSKAPHHIYKNKGWKGWKDFLGTG
jgi:hypothetical protein